MEKIIKELKKQGYTIDYKKGEWLNIARADGVHCEFYPCASETMLTGSYTINGKITAIDCDIEYDFNDFISYVNEILK